MARSITLNATSYSIPQTGDSGWSNTGGVDDYLVALSTGVLSKAGGAFTLTAEVDLGVNYSLAGAYFKSRVQSYTTACTTTSSSVTVTVTGSTAGLAVGQSVAGTGIPASTTVSAISGSTVTLSQNATASGTGVNLTFTSNPAAAGIIRLANADTINFRNVGNSADLTLGVNASGQLVFGGAVVSTLSGGVVPPAQGGTGVANNSANTLTFTGNYSLGLTLTGATSVQLPTSGTLATLAGTESPTNKTFDSTSTMTGVKLASFTPDGTHTWTIPAATDTAVGRSTTDTLANKSISGSSNTFTNIPNSATSATSAATASAIMARDSNANVAINNINEAFATTATAAGTTTLTVSSAPLQQFTGTTTQTVQLPSASTLATGCQFYIFNRSTGSLTVKDGSGTTLATVIGGNQACFTCAANGSTAGTWDQTITYTGTLPISLGGTGQTTANAALNALLPSQTGNSGKVLSTDGSNTSWAAGLTTTLTSAHIFIGNGSNIATDTAVTGDVTISNTGVTTLASTISGSKTWNDVQTFKYSSGASTAGSYDTSGQWTLGASGSSATHTVYGASVNLSAAAVGGGSDLTTNINASTSGRPILKLQQNGVSKGGFAVSAGASGHIITGDAAGDLGIVAYSTNMNFSGDGGTTLHGQLSSGAW